MAVASRNNYRRYLTDLDAAFLRDLGYAVALGETLENQTVSGDYNRDGVVDLADYTVWRDELGSGGGVYAGADGTGDGSVTNSDYNVWDDYFGSTATVGGNAATVPEPSGVIALIVCLLGARVNGRDRASGAEA